MKQIDRLIIKEIYGPWIFGVGLFSSLLFAATYLGRVAEYMSTGVSPLVVLEFMALTMPSILVKTFTMSMLLATLLGFGRLSSDSEIVALRAAGASVARFVAPVFGFSVLIAATAFLFNEQVVPACYRKSLEIASEIASKAGVNDGLPFATTVVTGHKLQLGIVARNVKAESHSLEDVTMVIYDDREKESYVVFCKEFVYHPEDPENWRVAGGGRVISAYPPFDCASFVGDAVPRRLPHVPKSFADLIKTDNDQDALTISQLSHMIAQHERDGDAKEKDLANWRYWYWNKFSVPLAALIFGAMGAVLGIRNHRTGTAAGFALAVGIIFGYVTLANFMNVWAMGGAIPSWVASFAPLGIGLVVSGVIMWRRNA